MIHSRKNIFITAVLGATWMAALAFGARVMLKYETTAGPVGPVAARWPSASIVPRPIDKPTLLMLAHPHCPCTRASIAELAQIMAHAYGKANAYVLFTKPPGTGPEWDDTDLRRTAAAIPGVTVLTDENGTEAARFGAETSGHVLVFDRSGTLTFSGGITGSRGHAGENAGESAVLAALTHEPIERERTPVFGCSLTGRASMPGGKLCSN
ncbi:MAG: hypothetical protein QOJ87_2307 [Verrucomicrobiota bacterium]